MGAASRLSLPSLASLYRSMTTLSTLSLVAPEAVAAAGSAKTKLKPKALASLASRKAPLRHRQRQTRRARKLSSSSSSSDSDTSSADVQGKRVPSSSKVSLDAEPHSPVSLPDSDVTALLESNDFDLSLGPSASVPITTRRRTSRNTTSGDESIPQLTSGDKKRRWRPDDDITAQSFLPLTKRPRAGLKGSNAEVPIAIISRTPKKSSDFIRYCIRPTLFEQFSAKDLEWCRYCGVTEKTQTASFRPGPWGKRTLCNKHGCDYKGYGYLGNKPRLNLSGYAKENPKDRIRPIIQDSCAECFQMGSLNSGPENWFLQCDGCAKGFHELCYTGPNALPSSKRRSSRAGVEAVAKWFCSKDCASSPGSSAKLVLDLPKRNLPMMKPLSPTSPSSPVPISSSTTAVSAIPLKRSHKKKVPISQPTAHPPKRSHKKKVVPSESALAPPKRSHKKKTVTSDSVVAPPKRSHKKKVVSSDTFAKYGSSDSIRRTPSQSVSNDGDWSSVDGIRVPQFVKQEIMVPSWASLDSHPLFGKKNSSKKKPEPSVVSKRKTTSSKVSTAKTSKNRKVDLTDNLAIENFMERHGRYEALERENRLGLGLS